MATVGAWRELASLYAVTWIGVQGLNSTIAGILE